MSGPAMAARGVTRRFGNGAGVFDLDVELWAGKIVALVGLNGAGKTTMMRLLLGMLRPQRGEVGHAVRGMTEVPCSRLSLWGTSY